MKIRTAKVAFPAAGLLATAVLLAFPPPAGADFAFSLNYAFSGASPQGPSPWLTFTFTDVGANTVQLMLTASLHGAGEFLSEVDFNFNPAKDPTQLSFAYVSGQNVNSGPLTGVNAFRADGDGYYDVSFLFPTSGDGFEATDTSVWTITGTEGLFASDFNFTSVGGALGSYRGAAHVQGISGSPDSGWIGDHTVVPAPESIVLGMVGFGVVVFALWRLK